MDDQLIAIHLAASHLETIRGLADELESVDLGHPEFQDAPLWSEVLINSGGQTGWMVAICPFWGLMGKARDLETLCGSLVAVGRKREREIAGRIKARAVGVDTRSWPGESPPHKPSTPRSIMAVARAWKNGEVL